MYVCEYMQILLCKFGGENVYVSSLRTPNSSDQAQQQQPPLHTEPSFGSDIQFSLQRGKCALAQTDAGLISEFVAIQFTCAFPEVRTQGSSV